MNLQICLLSVLLDYPNDAHAIDWANETFREKQRSFTSGSRLVDYSVAVQSVQGDKRQMVQIGLALEVGNAAAANAWAHAAMREISVDSDDSDAIVAYVAVNGGEYSHQGDEDSYEEGDFDVGQFAPPQFTDREIERILARQRALSSMQTEFATQAAERGLQPHSDAYIAFAVAFADDVIAQGAQEAQA